MSCIVYGCPNSHLTTDSSIEYFYFPKHTENLTHQWIQATGWPPDQIDLNTAQICSVHFDEGAYDTQIKMTNYPTCYKVLKYDAIPTLFLPTQTQILINDGTTTKLLLYSINSDNANASHLPQEVEVFTELQPSTSANVFKVEEMVDFEEHPVEDNIPEKYKAVKNEHELKKLAEKNAHLRRKIGVLEESMEGFKLGAIQRSNEYKELLVRHKKLQQQVSVAKKMYLTLQEQKSLLGKVFSESQIKILFGKKKIYWSNDDMAVGYTIRHLSSKRFYGYLTKTLHIPLPAVSSIKRWTTMKKVQIKKEHVDKTEEEEVFADTE